MTSTVRIRNVCRSQGKMKIGLNFFQRQTIDFFLASECASTHLEAGGKKVAGGAGGERSMSGICHHCEVVLLAMYI